MSLPKGLQKWGSVVNGIIAVLSFVGALRMDSPLFWILMTVATIAALSAVALGIWYVVARQLEHAARLGVIGAALRELTNGLDGQRDRADEHQRYIEALQGSQKREHDDFRRRLSSLEAVSPAPHKWP